MSSDPWKLSEHDVSRLNDSLERCVRKPEFLERFYDLFLKSSEDVRNMFVGTDFRRLKRQLKHSLYVMLLAASGNEEAWREMDARAVRHDRNHLNVRPPLYELWLHCLVTAVSECDAKCDPDIERIWRTVMRRGIEYMIERY
ncbi:MAG: globin [Phycisphaeraceae bacterium]